MSKLTPKQEMFVEAYLRCFNATQAAVTAGYSEKTARQQGSRLLSNAVIASRVRARMSEVAMGTDEVLARLAAQARADIGDVLDDNGNLDLRKARSESGTHVIRRIKQRQITSEQTDIFETEIELYDAQAALVQIGKHLGLFTNKVQIEDWRSEVIGLLRDGKITPEQVRDELGYDLAQELFKSVGISVLTDRED